LSVLKNAVAEPLRDNCMHFLVLWPSSGNQAGLRCKPKPKKTYLHNFSFWFDNLQHSDNCLTRHSDVSIICRQSVRHHPAPLLGGIKKNAT